MGKDADATETQVDAPRPGAPSEARPKPESTPPQLSRGAMVDHFRVMRRLGHGGMGEVYLARDTKLGRRVALKMVHASLLGSDDAVRRFHQEARAMARLNHPNILTIHGVGDHDGYPYVALEYVEGETLSARIRGRGSLGIAEALRIGLAIAQGLEDAHRHGVVHRDLKPSNVLVGSDGRIRLLDFGLATMAGGEAPMAKKGFQGTPPYMAPERWGGELGTAATDVWSFGALLFRLLSGRVPFPQRDLSELGAAVLLGEAPELEGDDLPPALKTLIKRCLSGSPDARPTSAELATALRDLMLEGHRARAPEESPFRGLLAFRERHADVFFGRDADVDAIVERLRTQPVVAVVGPSGAGKSSLVEAGVIPRLREQERWTIVRIRPAGAPMKSLATSLLRAEASGVSTTPTSSTGSDTGPTPSVALAHALEAETSGIGVRVRRIAEETGTRVLLFVDQLEELFTLADPEEAARFLQALTSAADDQEEPVRFLYTVRDDFLGRIPVSDAASALAAVHPLARPEPASLLDILTRPLELAGYRYEDDALPEEMVAAVQGEPACLPLLEFTAQMLWEHRDRDHKTLLRAEYERLGGVEGALARHADGVLAGLGAADLNLAREILLRLVTPQRTRQIASRTRALAGLGPDAGRVLERLTDARLVQASRSREGDDATLELAHESLVHTWKTLSEWIDASAEELEFLAEVTQAAELWSRRGKRDAELWEGQALADALRSRARCATTVPTMVDAFLDAGQRRERRRTWQKRAFALLGVSLLAIVTVVMAVQKQQADALRDHAEEQRARAEEQRAEALREGARSALARGAVLEARAKLRTAMEAQDSTMARGLYWVLAREPLVWQSDSDLSAYRVAFAPDGHTLVASRMSGPAYLVDADTGAIRSLRGLEGSAFAVGFSHDGSLVAAGSLTGDARVWRRETGELMTGAMQHGGIVFDLDFDPSSEVLATAAADGLRIWSVGQTPQARTIGDDTQLRSAHFSPDGALLASGGDSGVIHLYDPETGEERRRLNGHEGSVLSVRFSPDGARLASSGSDNTIRIWDLASGEPSAVLRAHRARVSEVAWSGDGELLVSASHDGAIGLWDPAAGELLERRELGAGAVRGVSFPAEGRRLAISSLGMPLRIVDLAIAPRLDTAGHDGNILEVQVSPDGRTIASAGADGLVLLWDAPSGSVRARLRGHSPMQVSSLAFTPDGDELLTLSNEGNVRIWDTHAGTVTREATTPGVEPYGRLAVSPDGATMAVALEAGVVRIYDLATTRILRELEGVEQMGSLAFSPDGRHLAAASTQGPILIWDIASGAAPLQLDGHAGGTEDVVFISDGGRFVTGGHDRLVRLWDLATSESEVAITHEGIVYGVADAPGEWIASGSADGTARLRRLGTEETRTIVHPKEVNTVALSRDGSMLVTGSDGGVVRAFDVATGEPAWRAPVMLGSPARLATHMGFRDLVTDQPLTIDAEWARAALEARGGSASGSRLCLATRDGHLVAWDTASDTRLWERGVGEAPEVVALPDACATLFEGVVRIADAESAHEISPGGAEALAIASSAEGTLLAATGAAIYEVPADGGAMHELLALDGTGLTAIAADAERLAVGYTDGNFEVHALAGEEPSPAFEQTPPSPVTRMILGPSRTVVVGFADGTLGIWGPSGALLQRIRLHGSIAHILLDGPRLHAASLLGRYVTWNLAPFQEERCEVLRAVWERIPVVWESGRAVVRAPDPEHPCAR